MKLSLTRRAISSFRYLKGISTGDFSRRSLLCSADASGLSASTIGRLKGRRRSMAVNARAALLGAQDRKRARQATKEPAAKGQGRVAGDLDGRDEGGWPCRV